MRIEILGSAAGGGFPQWNCSCANCHSLRAGTFHGKARTQTQVAIRGSDPSWFLLNASPDLRMQIEGNPALHPRRGSRNSPIAGVVLTSADLDHVVGLLSLREMQPFRVYSTPSVARILGADNAVFGMLNRQADQVAWMDIRPGESFALTSVNGGDSGLRCEPFSLASRYPAYVHEKAGLGADEATLGLFVTSMTGARLAYLPAAPAIDQSLIARLEEADLVLFDGTFWSDDELIRILGSGATAREMGHIPVSSAEGSLKRLACLEKPRKIYIHVNNTNPMLDESGAEYRAVRAAGCEVAEDGWRVDL